MAVGAALDGQPQKLEPPRPRIAHILDEGQSEAAGEMRGLCGARLRGEPATAGDEDCVVCLDLAHTYERRSCAGASLPPGVRGVEAGRELVARAASGLPSTPARLRLDQRTRGRHDG